MKGRMERGNLNSLTSREKEVILWLMRGYTSGEIGNWLSISPRTVESHIVSGIHKLNARNRVHLVAIVLLEKHIDQSEADVRFRSE
jgi:DNA-binding CsgD family transcriptional regulator